MKLSDLPIELKTVVVDKLYEYQLSMVSRRWHGFVVLLAIYGLLLNAYGGIYLSTKEENAFSQTELSICISICLVGIFSSLASARIIGLMTSRIVKVQKYLLDNNIPGIVDLEKESFNKLNKPFYNVTFILLFCILIISLPWYLFLGISIHNLGLNEYLCALLAFVSLIVSIWNSISCWESLSW